jgi:hypothetical protein
MMKNLQYITATGTTKEQYNEIKKPSQVISKEKKKKPSLVLPCGCS